ncbi:MAG: hypothetical protein QG670_2430 [Thermoproteota archaeon]|nr:hypothetical protein [Thermoproteota archaeon]
MLSLTYGNVTFASRLSGETRSMEYVAYARRGHVSIASVFVSAVRRYSAWIMLGWKRFGDRTF